MPWGSASARFSGKLEGLAPKKFLFWQMKSAPVWARCQVDYISKMASRKVCFRPAARIFACRWRIWWLCLNRQLLKLVMSSTSFLGGVSRFSHSRCLPTASRIFCTAGRVLGQCLTGQKGEQGNGLFAQCQAWLVLTMPGILGARPLRVERKCLECSCYGGLYARGLYARGSAFLERTRHAIALWARC